MPRRRLSLRSALVLVLLPLQLLTGPAAAGALFLCGADAAVRISCCCPQHPGEEPADEPRLSRSCCCDVQAPGPVDERAPAAADRGPSPERAASWLALAQPAPALAPPDLAPARSGLTDTTGPPGPPLVLKKHALLR